ncbi:MAG: sigma-70 family RNA polymerase sigma factor [Pyrinomonadaceae bacterium]
MAESEMTQELFLYGKAAAPDDDRKTTADYTADAHQQAFENIYRSYAPLVHGILLSRIPYDDVHDLVQEVFFAAFKNLGTLRDKNAVGAWLARIARNHAAEYYRRKRPSEELPEELRGRHNPRAEAAEILAAIKSLKETYRETLVLRLIEGLTANEIADRTGRTPESVRVNLHRGMEKLRKKLGIAGAKK